MARILLLSNGHGEDLSGALIGNELRKLNHNIDALPLVGLGQPYLESNINILGKVKEFSTGGIGYTSLVGRFTELLEGQIFYLIRRLILLLRSAKGYELIVVVGDVVPVCCAWLTRLPTAIYLVAYSSHYEGRLKLPWPCAHCLSSKQFLAIYSRDQLTADDLSKQIKRNVEFLGNPFMDPVLKRNDSLPICANRLGILPGSRRPELDSNILLILRLIEILPEKPLFNIGLSLDMALVGAMDNASLQKLALSSGWQFIIRSSAQVQLVRNSYEINIHRNSFVKVLQGSDLLLCMAGTAAEQAVGLKKPVLQMPGYGPQFTSSFAEAQRRLLGPTVFCADGYAGQNITLSRTASLIFELIDRSHNDLNLQRECIKQSQDRLGTSGGGALMAEIITRKYNQLIVPG